jgi:hypothetical protein
VLSLIHTLYSSLQRALFLLTLLWLHRWSGYGFQHYRFLSFLVRRLLSQQATVSQKDSTLLRNGLQQWGLLHAHSSAWGDCFSLWLSRNACLRNRTLLDSWLSRLTGFCRWTSWYSLGTDLTGNTASDNSSIAAWRSYRRGSTENTFPSCVPTSYVAWGDVIHCCVTVYWAIT